jgi:hypothetical protein
MSLDPRDKQDLRFACLRALYARPRAAFNPEQVAVFVRRHMPFSFEVSDVHDALTYIKGLDLVELIEETLGAGQDYFKITTRGQQDYERRSQNP